MIEQALQWVIIRTANYILTLGDVMLIILILAGTRMLLFIIKKFLNRAWKKRGINKGSRYAIYQIISYIIWIIAISSTLETIGIKVTILLAGSAALLVGVGLGVQQTFNDFFSGLILLLEGTIRVEDIIEVDGTIVKVRQIGMRTSVGESREDKDIIIPNSKIVNNNVINWTRNDHLARFSIFVGVAYGSPVDTVSAILIQAAKEHAFCFSGKLPITRLIHFGQSSLDFELLFWSQNLFRIEQTKSEIRIKIVHQFEENNIIIPFPQHDIYLKSTSESTTD